MANIHTFKDLESGPNSSALPDPWEKYPSRYSSSPSVGLPGSDAFDRQMQFQYTGIDGNTALLQQEQPPSFQQLCCLSCCPCFVGPLCSPEKQREYVSAMKTFSFVISVVQFILLIVALGIGGFASPSVNPMLGPPASALLTLGAKWAPYIKAGQVWRFITPIFLHAGFIHLFFNLFAQLRFGMMLERKWGIIKFVILYFVSGIGGVLMSCLLRPEFLGVGASGAIMGLMGGFLAEILLTWQKLDQRIRRLMLLQVVFVIAVTMLISAAPIIDAGAHFGGVLIGFLIGLAYFAVESHKGSVRKILPIVAIALVLAFFVIGLCVFYLFLVV